MSNFKINLRIPAVTAQIREAAERGLMLGAEHVLTESNKIVPHDEGTLMRSGGVDADGLTAAVSYDTPYAVRQHEEMDYQHESGRHAKYLETTFAEEADTVGRIIQTQIRQVT